MEIAIVSLSSLLLFSSSSFFKVVVQVSGFIKGGASEADGVSGDSICMPDTNNSGQHQESTAVCSPIPFCSFLETLLSHSVDKKR
jgi:hypothetical protein